MMMEKKEQKKEQTEQVWYALGKLLVKIGILCGVAAILVNFVFGIFIVHSDEMNPSVRDGDLCVTNRLVSMQYDRIVAYQRDGVTRFGRVIGLPGDEIDLDGRGNYTINGSYPFETEYGMTFPCDGEVAYPYRVPEGTVFVLCDNREGGVDSRTLGGIEIKETQGTVVLMLRRRSW